MRKIFRNIGKGLLWLMGALLILLIISGIYLSILYFSSDLKEPDVKVSLTDYKVSVFSDSLRICGENSLVLNKYGLWEAKLSGSSLDRGITFGLMAGDLLKYQEDVFVSQIEKIVPSRAYLKFLRFLIVIFNRKMADYIPQEFQDEIYGISLSCTHEYDAIGTPFERQMNYHAAHDIGHAMQEYMLVGCSSFAVWGDKSADNELIIGRNFDFWVGDDFARNKQVQFIFPDKGYKYASVSWPGMTGVVSGMNEKGLTITMNASKGRIPTSSAMPISLLAKEILLYAGNVSEAYTIAQRAKTFVSESLMIGSAEDSSAVIIEKTPEKTALFRQNDNEILCTNHYQSDSFSEDKINMENILTSDSKYRYERLSDLVSSSIPMDNAGAARVLRDRFGKNGEDIGLFNEKAVNQSIAHHSVIFEPRKLKMWVSTSPWQSGAYVCYDLADIFSGKGAATTSLSNEKCTIPADSSFIRNIYPKILRYRELSGEINSALQSKSMIDENELMEFESINPEYFGTYSILGDYYHSVQNDSLALNYWRKALDKEIPRVSEKRMLENKIKKYAEK